MPETTAPSRHLAPQASAHEGERALAALLSTLERLAGALADPRKGRRRRHEAELRPLVCDLVAHLRAAGATPDEVVARLTAVVAASTPPGLPPRQARALGAAVVRWCEVDLRGRRAS